MSITKTIWVTSTHQGIVLKHLCNLEIKILSTEIIGNQHHQILKAVKK